MSLKDHVIRSIYSAAKPVLSPIIRSGPFKKAGLRPFDAFLVRAKPQSRLSTFSSRYPFGLHLGPDAKRLHHTDANSPYGHEPELAHLMDLLVPDDGIFLDVGSQSGYFSVFLASREGFSGKIFAFEPTRHSFGILSEIIHKLNLTDTVICHNKAASDKEAKLIMDVEGDPGRAAIKSSVEGKSEEVQAIALDSMNFDRVDFMKIDVEGHEIHTLNGAKKLIATHKPFIFLESWADKSNPELARKPLEFLEDLGYTLFLPAWLKPNDTLFAFIGPDFTPDVFALVPFGIHDRSVFPSNPINIFACHTSQIDTLGKRYPDIQHNK